MTEIPANLQLTFIEHIAHLTSADYEKVPEDLVKLGFVPPGAEEDVKSTDTVQVLAKVYGTWSEGGGAANGNVGMVINEFQNLSERYGGLIFQVRSCVVPGPTTVRGSKEPFAWDPLSELNRDLVAASVCSSQPCQSACHARAQSVACLTSQIASRACKRLELRSHRKRKLFRASPGQPPGTTNRQPPAATNRQPPPTANPNEPPTANHQPSTANRQPLK